MYIFEKCVFEWGVFIPHFGMNNNLLTPFYKPPLPKSQSTTVCQSDIKSNNLPLDKINSSIIKDSDSTLFPLSCGPQRVTTSSHSIQLPSKVRNKIPQIGYSLMDWNKLTLSLYPQKILLRYTPYRLGKHNKVSDCLMALHGRVYDVSLYMKYHPGGHLQVMRGAGKDATALFSKVHPWVNLDKMLEKFFVGYLIPPDPDEVEADESDESDVNE